MTRVEFDQMVEQLELRYQNRGPALTRVAVGWAILGYAVLVIALAGSTALAAGCAWAIFMAPSAVTIKLGIVLGLGGLIIAWSIVKGVWVKLSPPEGETLTRANAPRLFEMIDSTAAKAGGIHFHRVLLTDDLNAFVTQIPRLGIFGWHRNYLCLGLQLLDALSPEEFHAVLAHEFAHLSNSHGRTGNWLYRIRNSWGNVAESLSEQGGMLVRPLAAFFRWFWPRFNARTFVLSRANEYEADAFSAQATSPAIAAGALQRIALEGRRLHEEFWQKIGQRSAVEAAPPTAIYHELSSVLKTKIEPANCVRWLNQQFSMNTDTSDTHPALRDRVSALGVEVEAASLEPIADSAADVLLGRDEAASFRDLFSRRWLDFHQANWRESYEEGARNREKIAELEAAPPDEATRWEILRLRCMQHGIPAMFGELEAWMHSHPGHHLSRFLVGRHLLSLDDSAGVELLESVADANPQNTLECINELASYHDRRGNAEAIRELKARADQHDAKVERAMIERNTLAAGDNFEPHGCTPEQIASHVKVLAAHPEVQEAWLVKKRTRHFPEWPHFVLVVRIKFPALKFASDNAVSSLLQTLANSIDIDAYLLVVNDEGANKSAAKQIKNIPGSAIYVRDK